MGEWVFDPDSRIYRFNQSWNKEMDDDDDEWR
jgi:hypothetical protein